MNYNFSQQRKTAQYAYAIFGAPKKESNPIVAKLVLFSLGVVVGVLITILL